ncbi:MAG: diaminopimelate epimerase [Rhizobiaceae bacterium]|nr:diaminopimelate epimerase [Rhizobiaceae bacterium]
MAIDVEFTKMNGLGNEIIVADMRGRADKISSQAAIELAASEGASFEQIMELRDASVNGADMDLRILNSDGSLAQACGNGTRCVVSWLAHKGAGRQFVFKTEGGLLHAELLGDDNISVDMGVPKFHWQDIPLAEEFSDTTRIELQIGPIDAPVLHSPSVANIGNPHCIFWIEDDVWEYDLERFGPLLENHPIFPERANISLARVVSRDLIEIRTWERGGGLTRACGSGACATLVCAVRKNYTDRISTIRVPGGDLKIEWRDDDHVIMTGPTQFEFSGRLDAQSGEYLAEDNVPVT